MPAVLPGPLRALLDRFRPALEIVSQWTRYKFQLGLYLLFFAIYLPTTLGHFWSNQQLAVYLTTSSLVEKHNLAIKPIFEAIRGPDGNYYSVFGLGQALLSIPLYLVGKLVESLGSPFLQQYFGGPPLGDWGGTIPIFFVNLFNVFVAPCTCLVLYRFALRLGFSRRASLLTTLLFGLSTLTLTGAHDYFQHPLETLLLLSTIYLLFTCRRNLTPRLALPAGAILALGVLTRLNLLLAAPLVCAYLFYLAHTSQPDDASSPNGSFIRSRSIRLSILFALPITLVFLILLYLNALRFGDPFAFNPPAAAHGFRFDNLLEGLYGNLLSPGRSLLLYSPPVILGLWFYRKFLHQHRAEGILFLALAVVYLLLYSSYADWMGGWAWGPRYLIVLVPYLMLPAAYAWEEKRATRAAVLLGVLGLGIQILGIAVNVSYVNWDWLGMKLSPPDAFLFDPGISPIPTHLRDLLAGRYVDLWLVWVYQHFEPGTFLLTLAVHVTLLALALHLLTNGRLWAWLGQLGTEKKAETLDLPVSG